MSLDRSSNAGGTALGRMSAAAAKPVELFPEPASPPANTSPLATLVETVERLASISSLEEVALVVRTAARRMTGADGVCFVIRQDDRCFYMDEDAIGPLWKGRSFPLTACISGWAMLNKQMAVIPDVFADPRIPHDAYRPTFVKSLVMTPVGADEPLAAIGAYWAEVRDPTTAEIEALQVMARATATAIANASLYNSLKSSLERSAFLNRELDHRVKNTLMTVQSVANLTLRTSPTPEAFVAAFNGRLQTLSRGHELLTREGWSGLPLDEVVELALSAYGEVGGPMIRVEGPDMHLDSETAMNVLAAFHELAANAAQHGALSADGGRVVVTWSVQREADPPTMELVWREEGGPTVVPPTKRGFGTQIVERGLSHRLGGQAELSFPPQGVQFHLRAPLSGRIALA